MGNKSLAAALPAALLASPLNAADRGELAPPVRVMVAGKPLDVGGVGYAAPFVGDFDGDGVNDLLVGQFGNGTLWVFRNEGSDSQPKLAKGTKFQAGGKDGTVPTG